MTVASAHRLTERSAPLPSMGTLYSAANQLFIAGTLVSQDAAGRAVVPSDGDGFNCFGLSRATIDNRTGSPEHGGAADAVEIPVEFGVFGLDYTGTVPKPGQVVYAVNNATVSTDSDTGARGIAGVCVFVRRSQCFTFVSPLAVGLYGDGAAVASDVLDLQGDVEALQDDALTAQAMIDLPISAFRVYSTGAIVAPWVDTTSAGLDATAESYGLRWNPSQATVHAASVTLPADLDDTADIIVHVMGARVGASDVTATATITAFFRVAGAAFDADANAGGSTTAFDGATTVITDETITILAADVPASPSSLLLTIAPSAALDADDLIVFSVRLEYTRKLLTA